MRLKLINVHTDEKKSSHKNTLRSSSPLSSSDTISTGPMVLVGRPESLLGCAYVADVPIALTTATAQEVRNQNDYSCVA